MLLRLYLLFVATLMLSLFTHKVFAETETQAVTPSTESSPAPWIQKMIPASDVQLTPGASGLSFEQIPQPLHEWVDWALYGEKELTCPYQYNAQQRACSWPSRLQLALDDKGGSFSQQWQVFTETQVRLPGDQDNWPQQVSNEQGELLLVGEKDGFPQVTLTTGHHTISGKFLWQKLPKALRITPQSGLIDLQVNGRAIKNPDFNAEQQLWLTQGKTEAVSEDNLDIQVFRKVLDSHPVQVVTSIKLRVSGKQRNAVLSPVLLDDFIPLSVTSELPARINGKQELQLQLRPGEWTLEIIGRSLTDRTAFTLPVSKEPWPQQEVWVFQADSTMRQVEVQDVNSIDPNQTRLPDDWKALPAYLMAPGETMKLSVIQRGVAQTQKSQVQLNREMWLDFDGKGYTLNDTLSGLLVQQSRLNVLPALELGRVRINDQAQFITRETEGGAAGVEIRTEQLNLKAESRYTGSRSQPPVNGWQHDLQQVETRLHLPPGWFLFSSSGTDNLPDSWVQDWSLLDLFLVLITALAIGYLYGWRWGAFALLTLVFIWHQNGSPKFIWLNLLAVAALLRVLPEGWFKRWLGYYRWLSLLVLAIIVLPYLINTIRIGLYPQLEHYYQVSELDTYSQAQVETMAAEEVIAPPNVAMDQMNSAPEQELRRMTKEMVSGMAKPAPAPRPAKKSYSSKYDMQAIDPNSMIQTGPGLPNWQGYRSVYLNWSGPVKADESSRLILVGPKMNLLIKLLGIALLLVLTWRMLGLEKGGLISNKVRGWFKRHIKRNAVNLLPLLLLPALLLGNDPLQAEVIPDQQTLQTLKQRLMEAPECLPNCAQIEHMELAIDGGVLSARLSVHASVETAIPLPGSQDTWLASDILLDQQPAKAVRRDEAQQLWLALPAGRHEVQLRGVLPARNSVPLPLAMRPHYVSLRSPLDKDWTITGIRDNGTPESQLQLDRVLSKTEQAEQELEQNILPTFVKVERRLSLGLDWYVETTVRRLTPLDTPLSLDIPLLANEQPMSEQLSIRNNKVRVNLGAQELEVSWSSRLNPGEQIALKAADNNNYLESWYVAASPVWHWEAEGLPVNRFDREDAQVAPVWLPWPGEELTLNITRPQGIPGQTVTIQNSNMTISTGKRASDVQLALNIRSSRGVQHTLALPENVELQELSIDGVTQRIQDSGRELNLTLKPGDQQVALQWREAEPLGTVYRFPEVNLGLPVVNTNFSINLPRDRWVLWANGPTLGPAVLFWGVLLALFILSLALGASKLTPLKSWQWFLLGIGLSQTETTLMILVAGWLVALALREKFNPVPKLKYWQFNLMQAGIAGLTFIALIVLAVAVGKGLLGMPEMQIAGNGSSSYVLNWYQDRSGEILPQPSFVSVPLWLYRALMLLWALWLAVAVIGWLRWGWKAMNVGGLWESGEKKVKSES